jgi:hypothetical protein
MTVRFYDDKAKVFVDGTEILSASGLDSSRLSYIQQKS